MMQYSGSSYGVLEDFAGIPVSGNIAVGQYVAVLYRKMNILEMPYFELVFGRVLNWFTLDSETHMVGVMLPNDSTIAAPWRCVKPVAEPPYSEED